MKRWPIIRNKNQQSVSLHTYGTPVKHADLRAVSLCPETTAHIRNILQNKSEANGSKLET